MFVIFICSSHASVVMCSHVTVNHDLSWLSNQMVWWDTNPLSCMLQLLMLHTQRSYVRKDFVGLQTCVLWWSSWTGKRFHSCAYYYHYQLLLSLLSLFIISVVVVVVVVVWLVFLARGTSVLQAASYRQSWPMQNNQSWPIQNNQSSPMQTNRVVFSSFCLFSGGYNPDLTACFSPTSSARQTAQLPSKAGQHTQLSPMYQPPFPHPTHPLFWHHSLDSFASF